MSTSEQPLTRKQLRELHGTGAVPVQPEAAENSDAPALITEAPASPVAPLPRAAAPAVIAPAPMPDSQVDLGMSPLTRRQAREQERIRTASVPVITPEVSAAHAAPLAPIPEDDAVPEHDAVAEPVAVPVFDPPAEPVAPADDDEIDDEIEDVAAAPVSAVSGLPPLVWPADDEPAEAAEVVDSDASEATPDVDDDTDDAEGLLTAEESVDADDEDDAPVATVGPQFGAELLAGDEVAAVTLPASFDELIARNASTTGALATPSALILSQTPLAPSLSGPVSATGEILVTGTFHLPEGMGSAGTDPRTTDGKEVDSVLIDGELPASSSPTPIAASAAISTVRGTGEIIRPPAPEKGSKLLFSLVITAGVLALALVGVLIVALMNGV